MKDKLKITAYECVEEPMPLQTATRQRTWIEDLPDRFAYRCLPLVMANQVGSHFGNGILTFSLGYLFRTTTSHNLYVKGPRQIVRKMQ